MDLRNGKSLLGKGQSVGDEGQWGPHVPVSLGFSPSLLKSL